MSRRSDALTAIEDERTYQDNKYGESKSLATDVLLISHYAEKVRLNLVHGDEQGALDRARKVAALALRAMETYGTVERNFADPAQHVAEDIIGPLEAFATRGDRVSDHEGETNGSQDSNA